MNLARYGTEYRIQSQYADRLRPKEVNIDHINTSETLGTEDAVSRTLHHQITGHELPPLEEEQDKLINSSDHRDSETD